MWRLHTCLIFTECVWHMMLFDNKPIHSHFRHVKHLAAFSQEGTVNLDTTVSCWKSLTSSKNSQQHHVRRRPYVTCMCKRPCCLNLQVQLFCWQKKQTVKFNTPWMTAPLPVQSSYVWDHSLGWCLLLPHQSPLQRRLWVGLGCPVPACDPFPEATHETSFPPIPGTVASAPWKDRERKRKLHLNGIPVILKITELNKKSLSEMKERKFLASFTLFPTFMLQQQYACV